MVQRKCVCVCLDCERDPPSNLLCVCVCVCVCVCLCVVFARTAVSSHRLRLVSVGRKVGQFGQEAVRDTDGQRGITHVFLTIGVAIATRIPQLF